MKEKTHECQETEMESERDEVEERTWKEQEIRIVAWQPLAMDVSENVSWKWTRGEGDDLLCLQHFR